MNKKKLLRNQRRQKKRGLLERQRRIQSLKKKVVIKRSRRKWKKVRVKTRVRQKWSLGRIITEIFFTIRGLYERILCLFGKHSWALHSGLPGTPKYMCRRCEKLSKVLWEGQVNTESTDKSKVA